ncbi:MAG: dTDP-4-dehydrorhamnose 3,5-epimerase [Alphaproteobacteria bacterium]|nr:dTDP-4-dehydrorhamnose 3,5-epimerase [Alphaproteobacteria bacterium]
MSVQVRATALPDVKLISPTRHGDHRGFFVETYNRATWVAAGVGDEFVQDNHSLSRPIYTVRGLHFQLAPKAQAKLVRVLRGRILDVAVDLRRSSPTFGQHVAVELSAEDSTQILVPVGFAHGFATLEPDTEVAYKVTELYSREHDRGIRWNDPAIGIVWPFDPALAQLSDKDRVAPLLADLPEPPFA